MKYDKKKLEALLAKVEGEEFVGLFFVLSAFDGDFWTSLRCFRAYLGSVYCALTLLNKARPECSLSLETYPNLVCRVMVRGTHEDGGARRMGVNDGFWKGEAVTPARAILIPALKIMIERFD